MKTGWNTSPVSMTELGIYLDWRKNLQGTAYNIPILSPLPDGTDPDRLSEALKKTLLAHPNLLSHLSRSISCSLGLMLCGYTFMV